MMRLAAAFTTAALALTGCSAATSGVAVSPSPVPPQVGGVWLAETTSGVRDGVTPSRTAEGSDGGELDTFAVIVADDLHEFWGKQELPNGTTVPEPNLLSYDSTKATGAAVCDTVTDRSVNAGYCTPTQTLLWDRGELLPDVRREAGPLGPAMTISHEYGHVIQGALGLKKSLPTLVLEQQADCLAGSYLRYVADGQSTRITADLDGINAALNFPLLAGDAIVGADQQPEDAHGTAAERAAALVGGYLDGVQSCLDMSTQDVQMRRADIPVSLTDFEVSAGSDVPWNDNIIAGVLQSIGTVLEQEPKLTTNSACAQTVRPATYCEDEDAVYTTPTLLDAYQIVTESPGHVGDGTSLGALANAAALRWMASQGAPTTGTSAGFNAACVAGHVMRGMAAPDVPESEMPVTLSAGDVDETLADLNAAGWTAADANGDVSPSVLDRTAAFLRGAYTVNDPTECLTEEK